MARRKFKKGYIFGVFVNDAPVVILLAIKKFYSENGYLIPKEQKELYGMKLVELTGIVQSHISKILKIFKEHNLINVKSGKDTRRKVVSLTDKGQEIADILQETKDMLEV